MDKETRDTIIVLVVAVAIIGGAYIGISTSSGVDPPFTVVESYSMQHSHESEIGVIDTGDMILVKSADKVTIQTYVDAYGSYSTFGEYGNVIIYERGGGLNPVIHRAILWLNYLGEDPLTGHSIWSAPSLADYPSERWTCTGGNDYNHLVGELSLIDVGYSSKAPTVNLDKVGYVSGYLTMGDNASTNGNFDQSSSIMSTLIYPEIIKSVAWIEVPWVGTLKLLLNENNNVNVWAANSIPCLVVTLITIIFLFVAANALMNYRECNKYYKVLNIELTGSPTPQFPVENKKK